MDEILALTAPSPESFEAVERQIILYGGTNCKLLSVQLFSVLRSFCSHVMRSFSICCFSYLPAVRVSPAGYIDAIFGVKDANRLLQVRAAIIIAVTILSFTFIISSILMFNNTISITLPLLQELL